MNAVPVIEPQSKMPDQTLHIRLATTADVPAIMALVHALVPILHAAGNLQWDNKYPNPHVFEEDIRLDQLWVMVSRNRIADAIAGVIAITTEQYPEYAQAGWDILDPAIVIHRLAVSPDFQGRGVAAELLRHAETIARSRKLKRVLADTNSLNRPMRQLLPKLGYTFCGEITLQFRPGMRFVCYEKVL